jgi:DNA-binding NtrC family response regulator
MSDSGRVLIIEEEALLALEIEDVLAQRGLGEFHHYRRVAEAERHCDELSEFRVAIVEARLGAAEVVAFTEQLAKAGVATVVMSADRAAVECFPHAAALAKPFDSAGLLAACDAAMAGVS